MKVLMVTPYFYPIIGGSETQVENLSFELNEIGVHADILTFNFDASMKPLPFERTEEIHGLKVIKIPAINFLPSKFHHNKINFMVNFIPRNFTQKLEKYDILHFHNETDLSFPVFSYKIRKPKIFHLRCLNATYLIFKRNTICRWMLRKIANIYIAQSRYVSHLLQDLGIPNNRLRIIPNAINVSVFRPGKEKVENRLLFVGRVEKYKGLHVLLKALKHVRIPVELLIVGPLVGESDYHEKLTELIAEVNEKTLHKVCYLGPKRANELVKYYQSASVVIVPSLSESFGNVILESLACETPVIASNVGGIPEIINGKSGILVPSGDYVKLANAIQLLLEDGKLRRKLGKHGRKVVSEKYSLEIVARKIFKVYKELLN